MESVGRGALEPEELDGRGRLTEIAPPAADPSIVRIADRLIFDGPASLDEVKRCPGAADLKAAVWMVASHEATSVTLSGFPDVGELVRMGRHLSGGGVVVEPLIRYGGGGFDIRVRLAGSVDG